ncbi:MAG: hypothetical protein V3V70_01805 [Candidatus Scalindua sp.]
MPHTLLGVVLVKRIDSFFKIVDFITTRKMKIDETIYLKIHFEFHKYSIDDLRTTGISVVLKKA